MNDTLKLYSYFRSSASYRVRIALNLKGLQYEYLPVHLVNNGGEQHSQEYEKINPSAELPTLVHKGKAIGQSVAIVLYLEEQFPEVPLFPKDSYLRAKTLQICEVINSGIQPLQNLRVLKKLGDDFAATEEQKNKWIPHWVKLGFAGLEEIVKLSHGIYCVGDSPTAADAFLVPQVFNAHRFEVSMDPYPTLKKIADACAKLEAFQKAHPDKQPDTP